MHQPATTDAMSTGTTISVQTNIVFDFLFMCSKHGMQRNFDQIGSFISFSCLNMTSIPFWIFPCAGCEPSSNAPSCRPGRRSILWELGAQHLFYARCAWNPLRNPLGATLPWSCQGQDTTDEGKAVEKKNRLGSGLKVEANSWMCLSGSQCSNDYHFSRLHLSSSAVAASSWYSSCQIESEKNMKTHGVPWRYHDTCLLYPDNMA